MSFQPSSPDLEEQRDYHADTLDKAPFFHQPSRLLRPVAGGMGEETELTAILCKEGARPAENCERPAHPSLLRGLCGWRPRVCSGHFRKLKQLLQIRPTTYLSSFFLPRPFFEFLVRTE